jgi:hypothetical protein
MRGDDEIQTQESHHIFQNLGFFNQCDAPNAVSTIMKTSGAYFARQ